MTDKEQIIIDGVDVSGCEKYPLSNKWHGSIIFCKGGCNVYPNCEYKQLQRKTAECEEYFKQRNSILEECQRYLEEIRKLQKSQFCVAYEKDCDKDCKQQNCAIKNSYCYRKALDEIEKIVTLDKTHIKYAGSTLVICDDILDIIRKAKGEED
jgi:hypothetical protein